MTTRYIFPLKVLPWSSLETDAGNKIRAASDMQCVGFVPVYKSMQALTNVHGHNCQCGTFVVDETLSHMIRESEDDHSNHGTF